MIKSASVHSVVTTKQEKPISLNVTSAVKYRDNHVENTKDMNSPHSPDSPSTRKKQREDLFKRRSIDLNKILHSNVLYERKSIDKNKESIHRISISRDIFDKKACYKMCIDEDHHVCGITRNDYLADMNIVIKYEIETKQGKKIKKKDGTHEMKYVTTTQLIGFALGSITIYDIYIDDMYMKEEYQEKYWFRLVRQLHKYITKNDLKCVLNEKIASPRIIKIMQLPDYPKMKGK